MRCNSGPEFIVHTLVTVNSRQGELHGKLRCARRSAKIIVFLVLLLPTLFGILGLVIDGGRLMTESGVTQHAADAGAIAAATALARGDDGSVAVGLAIDCVQSHHGLSDAHVLVDIPPTDGPYAGRSDYAEVRVSRDIRSVFIQVLGGVHSRSVSARAVAGREASTAGAAIVVLDPNPPAISLPVIPGITLPAVPTHHLGGMEVLGIGKLDVDGAVLVVTVERHEPLEVLIVALPGQGQRAAGSTTNATMAPTSPAKTHRYAPMRCQSQTLSSICRSRRSPPTR
ncbi:MAG: hypothetical protein B7Z55_18850 [Planctomycetales bacterium 12-60-4]|nr:MAG: hypothetical protein B7Z55_18850 [Planctomycetales bacterium 12-60-4]